MGSPNGSSNALHSSTGSSSTSHAMGVLHSSNHMQKELLLNKIGGREVLHKAVEEFYSRLLQDPRLQPLFVGANINVLKWHQYNIMSIAFSDVPENFRVDELILEKHVKLFEYSGLNEKHYDIVLEHFVNTLRDLNVDAQAIAEARAHVADLKGVFRQGAVNALNKKRALQRRQRIIVWTTIGTIVTAITIKYLQTRRK